MAIYRTIQLSFWTDAKVIDDFTPEDKYFYLYLMTNPHCNLAGCYELSLKAAADETGYNKETIERLLTRFDEIHNVIRYSKSTKEVLLLNWHKYNWTSSPKLDKPLLEQIREIKSSSFKVTLMELFNERNTEDIPYQYPMDTTVTVTNTNTDTTSDTVTNSIKEIIDYINGVTGSNYTYKNKSTNRLITARLNEGFTIDDFKTVIDKKYAEWKGTEMERHCVPNTLFAPSHFETYLNQKVVGSRIENRVSVVDSWV